MYNRLIGIHGLSGSGRELVATKIASELNPYMYKEVRRYGDRLKDICAAAFSVHREFFDDPTLKADPPREEPRVDTWQMTVRQMMNSMSKAIKNEYGDQFFINILRHDYERFWEKEDMFIISDIRTEDEADWVRTHGGVVIVLSNSTLTHDPGEYMNAGLKSHPQDYIINTEDAEALSAKVHDFMVANFSDCLPQG